MIQDFEDVRVYDLHVEALAHMKRCKLHTDNYRAWVNIMSECSHYRTLEEVRVAIQKIVENPVVPAARKRVYRAWLQGTKRYTR